MLLERLGMSLKRLEEWIEDALDQEKENRKSRLCKLLRKLKRDVECGLTRYEELSVKEFVRVRDVEIFKKNVFACMKDLQRVVKDFSLEDVSSISFFVL